MAPVSVPSDAIEAPPASGRAVRSRVTRRLECQWGGDWTGALEYPSPPPPPPLAPPPPEAPGDVEQLTDNDDGGATLYPPPPAPPPPSPPLKVEETRHGSSVSSPPTTTIVVATIVPLVVLFLAGAIILVFLKRRRRAPSKGIPSSTHQCVLAEKAPEEFGAKVEAGVAAETQDNGDAAAAPASAS